MNPDSEELYALLSEVKQSGCSKETTGPIFFLFNHSLLLSYIWIATLDDESIAYFYFVYVYNFFLKN